MSELKDKLNPTNTSPDFISRTAREAWYEMLREQAMEEPFFKIPVSQDKTRKRAKPARKKARRSDERIKR